MSMWYTVQPSGTGDGQTVTWTTNASEVFITIHEKRGKFSFKMSGPQSVVLVHYRNWAQWIQGRV